MASFTKTKRKKIYADSGGVCFYCGDKIDLNYKSSKRMEIDHVTPKSSNGSSSYDNLVASCLMCNRQKKGRDINEWIDHLEQRVNELRIDADRYERKLLKIKTLKKEVRNGV